MAFVNMHIFSLTNFLHFHMSLLLLTVSYPAGVSNKHCLLSLFSFKVKDDVCPDKLSVLSHIKCPYYYSKQIDLSDPLSFFLMFLLL